MYGGDAFPNVLGLEGFSVVPALDAICNEGRCSTKLLADLSEGKVFLFIKRAGEYVLVIDM